MDAPQHPRSAVRVGQILVGGLVPFLARRVGDGHSAEHRRRRAQHGRKHQGRRRRPAALGELGNDQRAQRNSERLRGLADPHRQAALLGREPPGDQPPAGRIAAGGRHAADEQQRSERHHRVDSRRRSRRRPRSAPSRSSARCVRRPGRADSPTGSASPPCRSSASTTASPPRPAACPDRLPGRGSETRRR